MRNSIITLFAAVALLASCNNQSPRMDDRPQADADSTSSGLRIACIEVDSLMTQFEFAKEKSLELERKSNNARTTLTQKGEQLQKAAANFQQKLQNNGFTSREQAEGVQAALQKQQNDLAALQQRLESELASEQAKFLQALQDSLNHYLELYNQDKHYDIIVNKSAVLLSGDRFDITREIVAGLNARYKKGSATAKDKEK